MRRLALPLLVLVSAFASSLAAPAFAAPTAKAPPTVRDSLSDSAKKDWDAGLALYNAKDFKGALAEFDAVHKQSNDPRVYYNMAVCQRSLLHYVAAADLLQNELKEGKDVLTADEKANVEQTIKGLENFITTLTVTAADDGATILVDGNVVLDADGHPRTTPLTGPIRIEPGQHVIAIKKDHFLDPAPQPITATASQGASARFDKLTPTVETVKISIDASAPGTTDKPTIEIDGKIVGQAPYAGLVTKGEHHSVKAYVRGRESDFVTAVWPNENDTSPMNDPQSISLVLAKATSQARLTIIAHPDGATIKIDGQVVTGNSTFDDVVTANGHHVEISKDGFDTYSDEVNIKAGVPRMIELSLKQDKTVGIAFWATGAVLVVAGGVLASIAIFKDRHTDYVPGTLQPGTDFTGYKIRFH